MRILAAHYVSGKTFLNDYRDASPSPRLFYRTKVAMPLGHEALVELRFPELPSRILVHATVAEHDQERGGTWLVFAPEDLAMCEFVAAAARGDGEARAALARKAPRFPLALPSEWLAQGEEKPGAGSTEDLSAGGAFVRTEQPAAPGAHLVLVIVPAGQEALTIPGVVTWIRRGNGPKGMGVRFDSLDSKQGRRLRGLLRRVQETGSIGK